MTREEARKEKCAVVVLSPKCDAHGHRPLKYRCIQAANNGGAERCESFDCSHLQQAIQMKPTRREVVL